jgi:hypothetical protein
MRRYPLKFRFRKLSKLSPKQMLGWLMLLNIFPIFTLLMGINQGQPLLESYLIGFAVDAVLSLIMLFVVLTLNLIYHD